MLDDYKDNQKNFYNLVINQINDDKLSHAYLIDENNNNDSFNIVLSFVKTILCNNRIDNFLNCGCCSICKRIDDGNYSEIKIIEPDGLLIKKSQLLELQQEFSRMAVEGNKKIYIIRDCDKMKNEAANCMLKFLEEPQPNIIAILMTNNFNNILSTIISRCQIIKLNNNNNYACSEENKKIANNFIFCVENKGIDAIFDEKEIWFSKVNVKERDKMQLVFDIIIDMYYDILNYKINGNFNRFDEYSDLLVIIANLNSKNELLNKILFLVDAKDSIKNNINSNLFIDNVILTIGGKNENSWN